MAGVWIAYPQNGATVAQPCTANGTYTTDPNYTLESIYWQIDNGVQNNINPPPSGGNWSAQLPTMSPGPHLLTVYMMEFQNGGNPPMQGFFASANFTIQ